MKPKLTLLPIVVLLLASCSTLQPGADPVVVRAEQTTQLALDTFNLIEKTEYETYSAIKLASPDTAKAIRGFTNNLRRNQYEWLTTARTLTKAYKENRTAENKANLDTALAVLQSAINESNKYLAEIRSTTQP